MNDMKLDIKPLLSVVMAVINIGFITIWVISDVIKIRVCTLRICLQLNVRIRRYLTPEDINSITRKLVKSIREITELFHNFLAIKSVELTFRK